MPLVASQHDNIFSSQYEGNHSVQGQNIQTIWVVWNKAPIFAPTLLGILLSLLLKHAFGNSTEGVCMQTRSNGRLYSIARLRAKAKECESIIRNISLTNYTAVTSHTEQNLQSLMERFSQACKEFALTSAWRRPTCWAKMWTHHLSSLSTTTNLKGYTSSPTLVLPSATTNCP